MTSRLSILLSLLAGLFLLVFFLWPLWVTLQVAFLDIEGHATIQYFLEVFINPLYLEGLKNALWIAVMTTLGCLLLAMPLALFQVNYQFWGRETFNLMALSPLMLPPFVGALGVQAVLGRHGGLNSLLLSLGFIDPGDLPDWLGQGRMAGAVMMNILHLYPIVYVNLNATLKNLDPALDEAAMSLGVGPWRRFLKITVPLLLPGIFAGGSLCFTWAFTELGVPLMFDLERVTSVQIFNAIRDLSGNPFPYALVVTMLFVSTFLFSLSSAFLRGGQSMGGGRAVRSRIAKDPGRIPGLAMTLFFAFVTALALGPHLGVFLLAFSDDWYGSVLPERLGLQHFSEALGNELTLPSISNSLRYAGASTCLDILLGIVISWIVVRTRLPARNLLDALAMLPVSVPGIVLALGYLALTREGKPLDFLIFEGDPFLLLAIAYGIRRLPYVVRSLSSGLLQISPTLEEASTNLGATPFRTLLKITLPMALPSLLAGGVLAFAFAMLEVSDSMILAQKTVYFPITKAMYTLAGAIGDGPAMAAALGVWSMLFLISLLLVLGVLMGRKLSGLLGP